MGWGTPGPVSSGAPMATVAYAGTINNQIGDDFGLGRFGGTT